MVQGAVHGDLVWPGRGAGFAEDLLRDAGQLLEYFMYMVIIVVVAVRKACP